MPALEFDAAMSHDLHGILCRASEIVHAGAYAYSTGELTCKVVNDMQAMQLRMAMLLAFFEDKAPYGSIEPDLRIAMRNYEETASAWLDAIYAADIEPEKIAA